METLEGYWDCPVEECPDQVVESLYGRGTSYCAVHQAAFWKHKTPTPTYICVNCKEEYLFKGRKCGSSHRYCPKCFEIVQLWGLAQRDRGDNRASAFTRHGLTIFAYHEMWLAQNGKCKLCGVKGTFKRYGRLRIDHDHTCCPGAWGCGKCVRGLLCNGCNTMIGHYENCEGTLIIEVFDRYLKESKIHADV